MKDWEEAFYFFCATDKVISFFSGEGDFFCGHVFTDWCLFMEIFCCIGVRD